MSSSEFRLPDRPIKVDPKALSRPAGTLIGAIVIGALLLFMGYWQLPALIQDTQIRQNPLVVYDSDVRNGECTSRQAIFVDCSADLVYSYNGVHYEKSVSLFFIDFHTGSYDVDVVISRDKPELATISIALDKYWNRVLLLGAFLIGFGIMVVMAIVSAAKVARARKVLAQPGRLTLTPVAITRAEGSSGGAPTAPSCGWAGRNGSIPPGASGSCSSGCGAPSARMVWKSPFEPE